MVLAGPIELSPGEAALVVGVVAAVALAWCLTGGLVALALSGRRLGIPLGSVAFAVTAALVGPGRSLWAATYAGWAASAAVGLLLAAAARVRRSGGPPPPTA